MKILSLKSLNHSTSSQAASLGVNQIGQSRLRLVSDPVQPEPETVQATLPWLESSGKPLSLGRLRQRCKTWPLEVWQLYLEHLDSEARHSSESLISPKALEEELEGMSYEIDECLEGPRDFSKLQSTINSLSFVQATIIQKVFWSGQTVREIAREMKLSRSTVQRLKTQALSALYAKMWDTSPFIRGEVGFLPQKEGRKRAA
jgi:DNA-directed RNA polymerase specialized sigma24 family protein